MPDDLGMQETVSRIETYRLDPTPVAGTTTVEWRSPHSGRVVAVTDVAPREDLFVLFLPFIRGPGQIADRA
jgi:hypothetical protein